MHLSLKGSLKSSLVFTYVKTDQALDLGNLEPFTIPDLSGNANTATLYSGIYVSTNGTTDKAIAANATALGSGNYYLTGKIKPAGTTAKTTMDGSTASNLTGLTAGVWQDFQTATASAITPSSINLGWDGTAFNATVDNWSDVKLHDASDDSVVAHYKLYDSADASLDGYPALDCVGGYHGAHVGCSSGSGEGVDADVAGIPATLDDKMYFDGVNDSVSISPIDLGTGNFILKATVILTGNGNINPIFGKGFGSRYFRVSASGAQVDIREESGTVRSLTLNQNFPFNEATDIEFIKSGNVISVKINGVTQTNTITETPTSQHIIDHIGFDVTRTNGVIWNIDINGQLSWDGTIADGNVIGTVNGNPVTVGQKRETILQTAGEDFNKLMWFDGVDDYVAVSGMTASANYFGACTISATIEITDISTSQSVWALGTASYRLVFSGGGNWIVNASGDTGIAPTIGTHFVEVDYNSSGQGIAFRVDGIEVWTGVAVGASPATSFLIGVRNSTTPGLFFKGLIYDFSITGSAVKNFAFTGNELVTWTDTTGGSNNGTVNGSPSLFHVAESETTAGQDALGNAIENPRPNDRVLNLTTGTGYAQVADSASLDLTTEATWELWGNFADKQTNNQEAYLAKYNAGGNKRSWNIAYNPVNQNPDEISMAFGDPSDGTFEGLVKISVPNEIASVVFTYNNGTLVAYVNGSSVGKTVVAGSVPVTLHQNNEPVLVGSSGDDLPAARLIGDIRIYDRALTADEVLKNYNARKGAYGL